MNMKKISRRQFMQVAALGAAALGLTACGGSASSSAPVSSSAAGSSAAGSSGYGDVTLKIGFNGDFKKMVDAVIGAADRLNAKYESEGVNTKISIETDFQSIDNSEFHNNIVFAFKSGDCPDLFWGTGVTDFVASGVALDLTDCINKDLLVDGITIPFTVNGKIYAMPFDMPMRVVYYSKDDLKAIGWTDEQVEALPQKIADGSFMLEDFFALCKEVVDKGGAKYGMVHRPSTGDDFLDMMKALGGQYYNEDEKVVFDGVGIERLLQQMYDNAQTTKITPNNLNQMGWDTINKMVGVGEAFAYFGPMFSATYVANAAGLDTDTFAAQEQFVLFPKSANSDAPFCTAAPQCMCASANTKYPEVIKAIFAELQGDSADLLAEHSASTYSLSCVKAANELDVIANSPILAPVTYMAEYAAAVPSVENASTLRGLMFDQIVSLELGQTTVEKAMKDVKTQAELNIDDLIIL